MSETMTRLEKVLSEVRCRGHATEDEAFDLAGLIRDEHADNAALRDSAGILTIALGIIADSRDCQPDTPCPCCLAEHGDCIAGIAQLALNEYRAKPSDGEGAK